MTHEEQEDCYENAAQEWEEMKRIDEEASMSDHVDWCSEQNFGVNNFGVHPKHLSLSKIRCDVGLHLICAIIRKVLYVLGQHLDRCSCNNVIFEHFDILWENTHSSNQFRYCEVLSRIDGSHAMKFIKDVNHLVPLIKTEYEHSACLNHMC